ncbi:MAG: YbaB/EbfC family nucleoid-associated protein [Clostridiales bacterium]|nr:YbaB/EbfC family nucleoid-associated protein [Clostridiales bacterium]
MVMNMQKLMKQAQKMQADMARLQDDLKDMQVEAASGGGMIKVVANCKQEIVAIKINPEVVDPDDVEMLEDLLLAAVKEAQRLANEKSAEEMQKITGGMGLPPGLF